MKTWIVNSAFHDANSVEPQVLCVGATTLEWIHESGDSDRPGDATTFVWVELIGGLLFRVGFRPHGAVSEAECIEQIPRLLRLIRTGGADLEPRQLLGAKLS